MQQESLIAAAFLAGFFGSTHCLGMCGAIVMLFEQTGADGTPPWARRLLYNTGRLGFYALLGAVAGFAGATVSTAAGLSILRIAAGLLVVALALNLLFDWRLTGSLERAGSVIWQRLRPLTRHVIPVSNPTRALGAGFLWGALPCGLVYSAVALAATSGSPASGAMTMLCFWLGTMPLLLLVGASGQRLRQWSASRGMRRVAGVLMLAIGVYAVLPLALQSPGVPHEQHAMPTPVTE